MPNKLHIPALEPIEILKDESEEDTGYNPYDHAEADNSNNGRESDDASDD